MPVALEKLSSLDKTEIVELAKELLSAVGRSDSDYLHEERSSVHLLRRLTIDEERLAKMAAGTAKVIVKRQAAQPTSFR